MERGNLTFDIDGKRALFRIRNISNQRNDYVFVDDIIVEGLLSENEGVSVGVGTVTPPEKPVIPPTKPALNSQFDFQFDQNKVGEGAPKQKNNFWR
mmetsp:Transcript_20638/g.30584  ORF Transcript_20638/g.30584 Transcript_20638/m.30584 type:complete len:96 (-) Transcript_20638:86-373(-)